MVFWTMRCSRILKLLPGISTTRNDKVEGIEESSTRWIRDVLALEGADGKERLLSV